MKLLRYNLLAMLYFMGMAGALFYLYKDIELIFRQSPLFNGMIAGVAIVGSFIVLRGMTRLWQDATWFEAFKCNTLKQCKIKPYALVPLKTMFITRKRDLTPDAVKDCLESVGGRLCGMRMVSRHLVWLPFVIGLLGSGSLLISYADNITPLLLYNIMVGGHVSDHSQVTAFNAFMHAFESVLLGGGVSLFLGIMDLNYGLAQASCFRIVEDWLLVCMKNMSKYGAIDRADATPSTLMKALITKTACTVDRLARAYESGEESTAHMDKILNRVSNQLDKLGDQMKVEQQIMLKMAENQVELQASIRNMVQAMTMDSDMKGYLDRIECSLNRMSDDMGTSRRKAVEDIRQELRLLTHTFAVANDSEPMEYQKDIA